MPSKRSIQREQAKSAAGNGAVELIVTYAQLKEYNTPKIVNGAITSPRQALMTQRFAGRGIMQFVKLDRNVEAELADLVTAEKLLIEQHGGEWNEDRTVLDFGSKAKQVACDAEYQELLKKVVTITGPLLTEAEVDKSTLLPEQAKSLIWMIEMRE